MQVQNTSDLSIFMDRLKEWAKNHQDLRILRAIQTAEQNSMTASELIVRYAETLRELKPFLPESLPSSFLENWDMAIRIGLDAVETVHYVEKERSIFSLG